MGGAATFQASAWRHPCGMMRSGPVRSPGNVRRFADVDGPVPWWWRPGRTAGADRDPDQSRQRGQRIGSPVRSQPGVVNVDGDQGGQQQRTAQRPRGYHRLRIGQPQPVGVGRHLQFAGCPRAPTDQPAVRVEDVLQARGAKFKPRPRRPRYLVTPGVPDVAVVTSEARLSPRERCVVKTKAAVLWELGGQVGCGGG